VRPEPAERSGTPSFPRRSSRLFFKCSIHSSARAELTSDFARGTIPGMRCRRSTLPQWRRGAPFGRPSPRPPDSPAGAAIDVTETPSGRHFRGCIHVSAEGCPIPHSGGENVPIRHGLQTAANN